MERFVGNGRVGYRVLGLGTAVEDCQCCRKTWTLPVAGKVVVDPSDRPGVHTTLLS